VLLEIEARRIIAAIADAAQRWCDADFPPRIRASARICERTGYSLAVVEYALDALFSSLTRDELEAVVRNELGDIEALDAPEQRAHPLGRVAILSSRTTIGVAIPALCFALIAKNKVLIKDREDDLVAGFAASLAEELQPIAEALEVALWDGARDLTRIADVDLVVVYGNDATIATIAGAHASTTPIVGFGARASVGYLDEEDLQDTARLDALLAGAARDATLYDGEGCMSLHALFFQRIAGGSAAELAERLAAAMERAAIEFPVGERSPSQRAALLNARSHATFRAAMGRGAVYTNQRLDYLVLLSDADEEPPPFLPRVLPLIPVTDAAALARYVERHHLPIECLAVGGTLRSGEELAARIGAVRVASFGEMQRPPIGAKHGGRPRILEFVRFLDNDGGDA